MDLEQIIQGGGIGLAAALIALVGFIIKKVFCLMNNHINSNIKAANENTAATNALTVMVHELKTWLEAKNGN